MWINQSVMWAYTLSGCEPLFAITAHYIRALIASWAFHHSSLIVQLCKVTTWSSVHIFTKFYKVDLASRRQSRSTTPGRSAPLTPSKACIENPVQQLQNKKNRNNVWVRAPLEHEMLKHAYFADMFLCVTIIIIKYQIFLLILCGYPPLCFEC